MLFLYTTLVGILFEKLVLFKLFIVININATYIININPT